MNVGLKLTSCLQMKDKLYLIKSSASVSEVRSSQTGSAGGGGLEWRLDIAEGAATKSHELINCICSFDVLQPNKLRGDMAEVIMMSLRNNDH